MQTKLTLRLDDELVRRAKAHARRSGKSVSRMVADYFALLDQPDEASDEELTPWVRSLLGALKSDTISGSDYYQYLERKHR